MKVVSDSRVTWATSVPILVFLGLSVLELGPMYTTDIRQTDVRQKHLLMPPPYGSGGIIIMSSHGSAVKDHRQRIPRFVIRRYLEKTIQKKLFAIYNHYK